MITENDVLDMMLKVFKDHCIKFFRKEYIGRTGSFKTKESTIYFIEVLKEPKENV